MPVTRSASRSASRSAAPKTLQVATDNARKTSKRSRSNLKNGRAKEVEQDSPAALIQPSTPVDNEESAVPLALVPAVLSFSFEEAKQHLIAVDARFADIFDKMQCRPFQQLERVHPFR